MVDITLTPVQVERAVQQAKGMLIAFEQIALYFSLSPDDVNVLSAMQAQTLELLEKLDGEAAS